MQLTVLILPLTRAINQKHHLNLQVVQKNQICNAHTKLPYSYIVIIEGHPYKPTCCGEPFITTIYQKQNIQNTIQNILVSNIIKESGIATYYIQNVEDEYE